MAPLSSEIKILLEEFAPNFTISKITPGFREDLLHWNDLLTSLDTFVNYYFLFLLIFLNLDLICAFSHNLSLKLGVSSFRDLQAKFVASREKLFSLNISFEKNISISIKKRDWIWNLVLYDQVAPVGSFGGTAYYGGQAPGAPAAAPAAGAGYPGYPGAGGYQA